MYSIFHKFKKIERHAAQAPALRERIPQFDLRQSTFAILQIIFNTVCIISSAVEINLAAAW